MTTQNTKLREDLRFRILRLLKENPEISQRELARSLGASLGRTHYMLNGLAEKGLIKLGNFAAAKDKRRYAYVLTPKGIAAKAALTQRFLERRRAEYDALRAEIRLLEKEALSELHDETPH